MIINDEWIMNLKIKEKDAIMQRVYLEVEDEQTVEILKIKGFKLKEGDILSDKHKKELLKIVENNIKNLNSYKNYYIRNVSDYGQKLAENLKELAEFEKTKKILENKTCQEKDEEEDEE